MTAAQALTNFCSKMVVAVADEMAETVKHAERRGGESQSSPKKPC
jgi:hypothetical protein